VEETKFYFILFYFFVIEGERCGLKEKYERKRECDYNSYCTTISQSRHMGGIHACESHMWVPLNVSWGCGIVVQWL
jgi:hypothetical protein